MYCIIVNFDNLFVVSYVSALTITIDIKGTVKNLK